jgi:hypothetical protein
VPTERRARLGRSADELDPRKLESMTREIGSRAPSSAHPTCSRGKVRGRLVVDVNR